MQDLAQWLETLGMSEYAQRFAENGINLAALRYLTDQDLKDIGVLLGHRASFLVPSMSWQASAQQNPTRMPTPPVLPRCPSRQRSRQQALRQVRKPLVSAGTSR